MTKLWISVWVVMAVLFSGPVQAESLYEKMQQGSRLYEAGEFDASLNAFVDAQIEAPEDVKLKYNVAASHYKMKNYEEAVKGFLDVAATAQDARLEELSLYNTGNAMYRQGKLQEAVAYYQKALDLDPEDADARHNLEFVREEIKKKINESKQTREKQQQQEQQQQEQQQQQQQQGDSGQQNGSEDRTGQEDAPGEQPDQKSEQDRPSSEGQDQQSPEGQDRQNAPVSAEKGNGENSSEKGASAQAGEMTEDEAEQWLNSLEENRDRFNQQEKREGGRRRPPSGKDW